MSLCTTLWFWIAALLASFFYGWKSLEIHLPSAFDKHGHGKKDNPIHDYPPSWRLHQYWLNFLGSLVGWLALWYLLKRYDLCLFSSSCNSSPNAWDIGASLIAFTGVTGHLPGTVIPLFMSLNSLLTELVKMFTAWLTNSK